TLSAVWRRQPPCTVLGERQGASANRRALAPSAILFLRSSTMLSPYASLAGRLERLFALLAKATLARRRPDSQGR
ncbi:MAG: hypothetical protein ACKO42_04235, partial [Gammaproteobacteria bacterium]